MDDNTSNDEEIQESPASPKSGGKKLKLNDGSSQDSVKDTVPSKKDENVDSGISADKSESMSSDDKTAGASEGPSNQVLVATPSTSSFRAILLNFRRPKRKRNYRKRKTPGRDTDSNSTSTDSDDLSVEESPAPRRQRDNSISDTESDHFQRLSDLYSTIDDSSHGSQSSTTSNSNYSYDSDDLMQVQSTDSDSDDADLSPINSNASEGNDADSNNKEKTNAVLLKTQPKHNFFILKEILNRELGMMLSTRKTTKTEVKFERDFYGSLHAVHRLKKLHNLNKHRGCVNSINFHPEGNLLASGSDDTNVIVWDWARKQALYTIRTGHKSNVFQSKFMYLNAQSQLNIVTCARDGQVRLVQCPSSGICSSSRRRLAHHSRAAHKLHLSRHEPHNVISAGEDGHVMQADVRENRAHRLFQVKENDLVIPLYSVHGHPLEPKQLVVAGRDKFVRVYDRRKSNKVVSMYCPTVLYDKAIGLEKRKSFMPPMHLTCAVYNHDGTEILGSYNDEDIYLFDVKNDVHSKDNTSEIKEGYTHRYSGHKNSDTYKGVSFFGPNSEYVVSGSDCSYIYIWDKKTEAIVQWLKGDTNGVVNCIEPHPRCPVLATSGLDKDIKIWMPHSEKDPTFEGLERVVKNNSASQLRSPLFNDFLPTIYSAWRGENGDGDEDSMPYGGNIEFDGNVCTTF